jgi:hypothetical protein
MANPEPSARLAKIKQPSTNSCDFTEVAPKIFKYLKLSGSFIEGIY